MLVPGHVVFYPLSRNCVSAVSATGGTVILRAPIELPDGARIKRFSAYGIDNAVTDMTFFIDKTAVDFPSLAFPSITESSLSSFTSSGASDVFGLTNPADLNEDTGNTELITSNTTRFYEAYVTMPVAAGASHQFCGMEITYQVPAVANAVATAFYPISPVRAYDSRLAGYAPNDGVLARNTSRVINIKDGHDGNGTVNLLNAVPAGATAVSYNITVTGTTGPNFLGVTAGDAASFTASAINFNGTTDLANAAVVSIAADRTIKVWGGDQTGSTHFIIDITGFYAPLPNMGN